MTYYEILEVSENATQDTIDMLYKNLISKYQPENFQGESKFAEEQLKKLNEAYSILSDPNERKKYDEFLASERSTDENKKAKVRKEKKPPTLKRSVITVSILFPLLFVLTFLAYAFIKKDIISSLVYSVVESIISAFLYTLIPFFVCLIKKEYSPIFIRIFSGVNSVVVLLLINAAANTNAGSGWIIALIYFYINTHIMTQLIIMLKQRRKRLLALLISLPLAIFMALSGVFGFIILENEITVNTELPSETPLTTEKDNSHLKGPAPEIDEISHDIMGIFISADSSAGVGDVFSIMNTSPEYKIFDNKYGYSYDVNFKAIGGIGVVETVPRYENGKYVIDDSCYVYGKIHDCWYSVILPDGTQGFVWGGPNAMYVDEIYN